MRAITLIILSALGGMWAYYGLEIAGNDTRLPQPVANTTKDTASAASLNNEGVALARHGKHGDALAYIQRAHTFRPDDAVIAGNLGRQTARVRKQAWLRSLGVGTLLAIVALVLLFVGTIWRIVRGSVDHVRLARLRLRGDRRMRIERDAKEAELAMRFSQSVCGLSRRHKPNVVWTCASQNQHMKSRRSVRVKGRDCRVTLDASRLKQLRKYPGEWRCILRLGDTEVGEAAARVV